MVISLLSLLPGNDIPFNSLFSIPHFDKLAHFSMYAALGFVAIMESRRPLKSSLFHLVLILILFLLSGMIEILQATVASDRGAEWYDLLANFLGLWAGFLAFILLGKFRLFRFLRS
jgi:VanZ family protein